MSETATATVSALYYYPVKSTRGIATAGARLVPTGLAWDRQWMIVDAAAHFLTQRTHPHMARIVPQVREGSLALTHPQLPDLHVPQAPGGEALTVRIWDDVCEAVGEGSGADAWLTRALGEPVRLVRARPQMRAANARYAGATPAPIGFPDGYPVLVVNAASLADLNARLPQPMPMERFRPNIVLEGLPAVGRGPHRRNHDRRGDAAPGEALPALLDPHLRSRHRRAGLQRAPRAQDLPLQPGAPRRDVRRERGDRARRRGRAPPW